MLCTFQPSAISHLKVKDLFGRYEEKPAGDWFMLFQDCIKVTFPTTVAARLSLGSEGSGATFMLRFYDNDTCTEVRGIISVVNASTPLLPFSLNFLFF